jgi:regulator of replication initiation timing
MLHPDGMDFNRRDNTLAQILGETTEQNKALKIEVEDLRQKLRDALGDIKVNQDQRNIFHPAVNRFAQQTLPTISRKHFFMNILCIESFCSQRNGHQNSVLR